MISIKKNILRGVFSSWFARYLSQHQVIFGFTISFTCWHKLFDFNWVCIVIFNFFFAQKNIEFFFIFEFYVYYTQYVSLTHKNFLLSLLTLCISIISSVSNYKIINYQIYYILVTQLFVLNKKILVWFQI